MQPALDPATGPRARREISHRGQILIGTVFFAAGCCFSLVGTIFVVRERAALPRGLVGGLFVTAFATWAWIRGLRSCLGRSAGGFDVFNGGGGAQP
jgi:hypothetical protein